MPELLSNTRHSRQRPAAVPCCMLKRPALGEQHPRHPRGAASPPQPVSEPRAAPNAHRCCMSEELGAPNDPSLCSSRGSLTRYNSISRTSSHTETSQGVLQAGDHVESNQMPIKISSGVGGWLLPWSTPVLGSSAAHLSSLPRTRASPPLPRQDGPSFSSAPHIRDGTGHLPSSQTQLSRTTVPTKPSWTTPPQSHFPQKGMVRRGWTLMQ